MTDINNPQIAIAEHLHSTLHDDIKELKNDIVSVIQNIEHIETKCKSIGNTIGEHTPLTEQICSMIESIKRPLCNANLHTADLMNEIKECSHTIAFHECYY